MQRPSPTLEDRLVLAQVVHLLGASDWQVISTALMRVSTDRGKQIVYTPLVSAPGFDVSSLTELLGMRDTMVGTHATNKCQYVRARSFTGADIEIGLTGLIRRYKTD